MKGYRKTLTWENFVNSVLHRSRFVGLDETGQPIYEENVEYPVIKFNGTVKLHGTNAGVSYNVETGEIWPTKKSQLMKSETGHMGFNEWVFQNKDYFLNYFKEIDEKLNVNGNYVGYNLYGEWAGKGIWSGESAPAVL